MNALDIALLYLLAAVLGVVVCRMLRLPAMIGYLAVGVLIGPNALALAQNSAGLRYLAEFGVVFLMFVIGLEFSLPKLRAMKRFVFGLGAAQVVLTVLLTTGASLLLGWLLPHWWKLEWQMAVAMGGVMAMSSTAIVVKLMADRLELESEHGQRVIGVLLFQDLAVVPLLVLIPALAAPSDNLMAALLLALAKAAGLLTLLLTGGQRVMRWWLTLVARRKSQELFVLNLLLVTLGLAWLTEHAGLSLALGAFVAGMLIAETEYKHQVESDIRPFHDVLLGLFFISIGMMLDWRLVLERWPLVLLLLGLSLAFKVLLITAVTRAFGAPPGVSLRVGLYLMQAGEFGLVLLQLANQNGLVPPALFNPTLASMIVSMLLTPFIVQHSNAIVVRLVGSEWLMQSVQMTQIARRAMARDKHVIICGYGRCGQNLARLLDGEGMPYMALDLDPDRVRQAAAAGHTVVFGDAARLEALMAAGLARASAVVVTYLDTPSALKVLHHVREHAPTVPVVVRTVDDSDLARLQAAGATEVVPEALEASLMLASHALALVGVPLRRVVRLVQQQREARYQLLRGYFHGADDDSADDPRQERLATVVLPPGCPTVGRTLGELALHAVGVRVMGVRRATGRNEEPDDQLRLQGGDAVVLFGAPEPLALAENRLLAG
ncbi:Glutathione-regulated potassium-efflux system protein KefC [Tepidimonas thermarum]|uniref:Glutathione-regulated potassium-efflux system protein KefC n=1 Tax=Tepidimonas thermarum TaxID=335431 RepID=A0A554WXZ1_9BURK|nr:monovalent cation:proton antiporter-2 (CPA2) family protein [Tepidimonas thermarum]TSE28463.1 Glutathione-regulated potassium-efflux system protein KefC [Tepidimonas thermarum]